jgi:branched-chain amino acid transport system substrate-binding protein
MSDLSRRKFLRLSAYAGAGVALAPTLSSCAGLNSSGGSGDDVVLGMLDSMTGVYASSGKYEVQGIRLAVAEANKAGGILGGRHVKTVLRDDATDPAVGVRGLRELVQQENVDMVVGVLSSGVGLAVSEAAFGFGVPFMCTGAHDDQITGSQAYKTTFRATTESTMIARAVAPYIAKQGGKKWFFITADYAYGIGAEQAMTAELRKLGGEVVGSQRTPLGTSDFSAQLTKARNSDATAIVLVLYGPDLVAATKQFHQFGLDKKFYLGGHLQGLEMAVGIGPAAMQGLYGAPWSGSIQAPKAQELFDKIKKVSGGATPSWRHYLGYLGAREAIQAIDRAGTTAVADVVSALEGHHFEPFKPGQGYWRAWDHQAITDVAVIEAIPKGEWQYKNQYFKTVALVDGEKVALTEEENAVAKNRLSSQDIPKRANYTPKSK